MKNKSKKVTLNIREIEIFCIACLLTGMRHEEKNKIQQNRLDNQITTLLKQLGWKMKYNYYLTLKQTDWAKVPGMAKKLEKLSESIKKKNSNEFLDRVFSSFSASVIHKN